MRPDYLLLCFALPAVIVYVLHRYSYRTLRKIVLVAASAKTLRVFVYARLLYWYIFSVLVTAFFLGMVLFSSDGNTTRSIIAYWSFGADNVPTFVIERLSNVFLPLIFATLFVSMIALGMIGRSVLKQMPEEGKPEEHFTRFRFTFVLMALSLVIPPLAFGSLLLL